METHCKKLDLICRCRVGGRRFSAVQRGRTLLTYSVNSLGKDLKACFSIDVADDHENVHSQFICYNCMSVIKCYRESKSKKR